MSIIPDSTEEKKEVLVHGLYSPPTFLNGLNPLSISSNISLISSLVYILAQAIQHLKHT